MLIIKILVFVYLVGFAGSYLDTGNLAVIVLFLDEQEVSKKFDSSSIKSVSRRARCATVLVCEIE